MSILPLRRPVIRPASWICNSCASRQLKKRTQRRWQTSSVGKSLVDVLEERGYLNQITGSRDELSKALAGKNVGAYVGIDPTASSMHVGHLIPFMTLFWLYLYGHKTFTLIGGGTASVGDPTGRIKARPHLDTQARRNNVKGIDEQLRRIWKNVMVLGEKHGYSGEEEGGQSRLINNEQWLADKKSNILEVLSTVGAGLRLGAMLGRDTVKTRMTDTNAQEGMSFSEFCYPVLQAWDWWNLYKDYNVSMQIGGSDQYGNILSGVDGIKYALKVQQGDSSKDPLKNMPPPLGFTVPLLTTPSGEKFGKSAGNAIWLDHEQTSVFDLYGFFVGTPDSEVKRLLNFFTFLPKRTIQDTMQQHTQSPEKRVAQHLLAREFVELVHGPHAAEATAAEHLNRASSFTSAGERKADITLPVESLVGQPYAVAFHTAGLSEIRGGANRLIESGGGYIIKDSGEAVKVAKGTTIEEGDLIMEESGKPGFLVLRAGKWKIRTIEVIWD